MLLTACATTAGAGSPTAALSPTTNLAGPTVQGGSLSEAALHGHPVVLAFWASWCGPCHDEQPRLNAAYQRWQPRGVRFLGVDMLDSNSAARGFIQQEHVPYTSVVDADADIAAGYQVPAAPAIVFLDAHGAVADRVLGGLEILSDADFDAELMRLTSAR